MLWSLEARLPFGLLHSIMRRVSIQLFGVGTYARAPLALKLFGRPLYTQASYTQFVQILPCKHARWICACLTVQYKDDPRHEEYKPIWLEMQNSHK